MTLGQRIPAGSAEDLAASLPMEVKWYLTGAVDEHGQRFDRREFVSRVSEIEGSEPPEAAYHAQVILDFVNTLVPPSDLQSSVTSFRRVRRMKTGASSSRSSMQVAGVTPKKLRRAVVRNRAGDQSIELKTTTCDCRTGTVTLIENSRRHPRPVSDGRKRPRGVGSGARTPNRVRTRYRSSRPQRRGHGADGVTSIRGEVVGCSKPKGSVSSMTRRNVRERRSSSGA